MQNNKRLFYLLTGMLMMMFLGLLYAWSIFVKPFRQIYTGWSVSDLSLTFTISMIFFCTGGFIGGKLSNKLKPKNIIFTAAALLFAGFMGLSKLDASNPYLSLKELYLFYGVICGTGVGIAYNAILGIVSKWFPDKVGITSGILLMGFGFGGLVLGSLINYLVSIVGLMQTFFILAILNPAVLIVGSLFLKTPPKGSLTNYTIKNSMAVTSENIKIQKNYTATEMIKTFSFWFFFFWGMSVASAGLLVMSSAATIASSFGAPAVLGLLVSVFNGAGRVVFGMIFDKYGCEKTMLINNIALLLAGISLCLGSINNNVILIFVGLLMTGVCFGGAPSTTSSVIYSLYGPKNYPLNFSISNFVLIPASIIGPMVLSTLLEISKGDYTSTFAMLIIFSIVAMIFRFLFILNKKKI